MPNSESRTTSSSDTTEHPGDLTISGAPGRKSTYLYIERGSRLTAIARFLSPETAEEFRNWAMAASAAGMKIKWIGDGEEGDSEEQA
jgi:hypothetical protein